MNHAQALTDCAGVLRLSGEGRAATHSPSGYSTTYA